MTSKQRAFLNALAAKEPTILQIGKSGLTPALTKNVEEALSARELVKVGIVQNQTEDPLILGETLARRTQSTLVQHIGRKLIFYRPGKGKHHRIALPQ